jgi:hypothetical protein
MFSKALLAAAAILFAMPQIAISQNAPPAEGDVYTRPESAAPAAPSEIPQSRLLAGVRAYPPGVLRALFAVSQNPEVTRQLAQDPQKVMNPQAISPPVSAELQGAIRQLQQTPEIVALAAAYPDEVAKLRQIYESAPEQTEQQLADLRARYDSARLQGDEAWEDMLSQNPAALDEYRNLVTQFTRDQLKQYREFPYIEVKQPQYYYAAPPNELIIAYAQDRKPGAPLDSILNDWWSKYGPDQVDQRILAPSGPNASGQSLAALPPQQRAEMWQPASDKSGSANSLLPIIMQPMVDQPPDARAAYAVAENARLWSGPENEQMTQQPPVAAAPKSAPQRRVNPQYAAPDTGQYAAPEQQQTPANVQQGPDYEYEYAPEYEQPEVVYTAPATVYYSPLVPYYYGYPAVWPVAYTYYPGLYSYWPYSWYGPGAYFSFSFGYGPHYYHYGHGYWGDGYWGGHGYWGHGDWGHGGAGHYYGHRFGSDRYGHGGGGDRYGHGGGGDHVSPYGRGGDRFSGGRGGAGGDGYGRGGGGSDFGRGGSSGDRSAAGRGGQQFGERDSSTRQFGGRQGSQGFRQGGGRTESGQALRQGTGGRTESGQGFRQGGGSSSEGGQGLRQGGGSRSFERGQGFRQGGGRSFQGSQGGGARTFQQGQGSRSATSLGGSRGMGSISRAPHMSGTSGASRGFQSAPRSFGGSHQMGSIRSGGGGGFRSGGGGGFHGGGGRGGGGRR